MEKIKLDKISTRADKQFDKETTKEKTTKMLGEIAELQNLLYAEGKHSILMVIQGMDASGKDGAIKHVFGPVNPQGVMVQSFKTPTAEEQSHDFLWRVHQHVPAKGMMQIFNRSHYEDILITRVHNWIDDDTAQKRMKAINHFEELLIEHNNTHILKFYLHVSLEEQHKRLEERMKDPAKMWKYNSNDLIEEQLWKRYMEMYEDCFANCNKAPWTIVPSDQNWYKEYIISAALRELLLSLKMKFPGLKK